MLFSALPYITSVDMLSSSLVHYIWVHYIGSAPGSNQAQKAVETKSMCLFNCSSIGFPKLTWSGQKHGTIYISMPTGLSLENSCLVANPWVIFSSPLWLRLPQLLCQLWWESDYVNMVEKQHSEGEGGHIGCGRTGVHRAGGNHQREIRFSNYFSW